MHRQFAGLTALTLFAALAALGAPLATPTDSPRMQGPLGSYHPFKGSVYAARGIAEGTTVQDAFAFGINAFINRPSYNAFTFEENVQNNCGAWDVNLLYGILVPPSEQGSVNHPGDDDPIKPAASLPGMIQGAHRFSELSRRCPQLVGLIVDDLFNNYPKTISRADLSAIKDALHGHALDAAGRVDATSPALTPALELFVVVYEHELSRVDPAIVEAADSVSFWIWKQSEHYARLDAYLDRLRTIFPGKPILPGVYIYNSAETPSVESIHTLVERDLRLYDEGHTSGLLLFSAIWLSREHMSRERWDALGLPALLDRVYYPNLGDVRGRLVDASGAAVAGAVVTVIRRVNGATQLVARKATDANGEFRFGVWVGASGVQRGVIEIRAAKDGRSTGSVQAPLAARKTTRLPDLVLGAG
jgi:hypothetical protein